MILNFFFLKVHDFNARNIIEKDKPYIFQLISHNMIIKSTNIYYLIYIFYDDSL